jgi:hypothetical protein
MARHALLACLIGMLAVSLSAQTGTSSFSFEESMEGWEVGTAMGAFECFDIARVAYPECGARSSVERLAAVRRTAETAFTGSHSIKITMDGGNDAGNAWIVHPFTVVPGGRYKVRLTFYVAPLQGELNSWPIIAYIGAKRPSGAPGGGAGDLVPIGSSVSEAGWARYDYSLEAAADTSGTLWVAAGLWATYEVARTYYLDSATIAIDPVSVPQSAPVGLRSLGVTMFGLGGLGWIGITRMKSTRLWPKGQVAGKRLAHQPV